MLGSRWAARLRCSWVRGHLCVARGEPDTNESAGPQSLGCAGWGEPDAALAAWAARGLPVMLACVPLTRSSSCRPCGGKLAPARRGLPGGVLGALDCSLWSARAEESAEAALAGLRSVDTSEAVLGGPCAAPASSAPPLQPLAPGPRRPQSGPGLSALPAEAAEAAPSRAAPGGADVQSAQEPQPAGSTCPAASCGDGAVADGPRWLPLNCVPVVVNVARMY